MRGIPIPFDQVPKTATRTGQVERARGPQFRGGAPGFAESAGNAALVSARGFIVAEQSVGQIGQAVQGEGQAMARLRIKQNEAIGIRKEQEAIASMDAMEDTIKADLINEPDESKWGGIVEKRGKALSDGVLTPDLSPEARDAIGMRLDSWQKRIAGITAVNSARKSFEKAGQAVEASMIRAVDQKDYTGALDLGRQYVAAGHAGEDWLAQQEVNMRQRKERNDIDEAYGFAVQNPDAFIADPDAYLPEGATAVQRDSLLTQARQSKRQAVFDASTAFDDRLYSGEFKTLADMQAAFPVDTLGEKAKAQAESIFIEMQKPGVLAQREADAPANFARLTDEVESYDPKSDEKGERYVRLAQEIKATLPESTYRGDLLGSLQKKYNGTGVEMTPPDQLKQSVSSLTLTMFEAGAFGNYKHEVQNKNRTWVTEENPKEKQAAQVKRGELMLYMHKWMAANPEATVTQANEAIRGFMAGRAPMIRSVAPVPGAPPAPRPTNGTRAPRSDDDLPEDGASPDNGLIPFFLPPSLQSN